VGKPGLKKVHRYSVEFKLTAVKLSGMPGVQVQTVADALDIHPFMLSRWRKEARDGILKGRARRGVVEGRQAREIKRLQTLEREHAMLREEHELLKNDRARCRRAICSTRNSRRRYAGVRPGAEAACLMVTSRAR